MNLTNNVDISTEPVIEVTRIFGNLSSIKVIMPMWDELGEDDKIYTKMPMLGGLTTYGSNVSDSEIATKEAIQVFCLAAEKHGSGLENELQKIGWNIYSENGDQVILKMQMGTPVFELILETGETKALNIELNAA